MKSEKDVKAAVKKILQAHGDQIWYYMPVPTGFGVQGVPDFVCCVSGFFFAIETKFGTNGLTPWQIKQMDSIREAKGEHFIINEDNLDVLEMRVLSLVEMNR